METDTLALKLVRRVVTALAIATASACVMAAAVPRYAITDLGTLGGNNESYGFGINNRGDVAGKSCSIGAWPCEGFTYSRNSGTQGLGTVGATSSIATDINDSGKIVLSTWDSSGNISRAYVAQLGSAPQDLGTLGGSRSQGAAINDAGQAVGASYLAGNSRIHAFLYTPGGPLVDLGTLGGSLSAATDISDVGSVVGAANLATGLRRAFYWSPGVGMVALPTTGPGESMATGINDYEQIVGWFYTSIGALHAFLYDQDTGFVDIDTQGWSQASAINNAGEVVGTTLFGAFLYTTDDGMIDLNTLLPTSSGWHLSSARAINDQGQIVGFGEVGGDIRAFLLTPIPEPGSLALIGLGIAGLTITRRRKQ